MEKLLKTCQILPCDLSKVRAPLETNHYTSADLMKTVIEFWELAAFMDEHEFADKNGCEPLPGELPVHHLYDLLKLFLEFGLDLNKIVDEENILYGYLHIKQTPWTRECCFKSERKGRLIAVFTGIGVWNTEVMIKILKDEELLGWQKPCLSTFAVI